MYDSGTSSVPKYVNQYLKIILTTKYMVPATIISITTNIFVIILVDLEFNNRNY